MSSLDVPGIDVSGRVRARDIQMAGVADLRSRTLMITGALDAVDHDVSMSISLPEPGRWRVIKSETNLTDRTWAAMQVSTDEDTTFVDGADTLILSRQFARTFLSPDLRRITFYEGEVRPGEAVLMMFDLECTTRRPAYAHSRLAPGPTDTLEQVADAVQAVVADGMPQRSMLELAVPVIVIG